MEQYCIFCKNILEKNRKKFCNIKCNILYNKQQKKIFLEKHIIYKNCIICKNIFKSKNKKNICCTLKECKKQLIKNQNIRYRKRKKEKKKKLYVKCKYCKKLFQKYSHYKYCSKECRKRQEHIDAQNKRRIQYYSDIKYRLRVGVRTRFKRAIKNNSKKESILKLIGCNIEELKQHLEKQFIEGMNWNNYGYYGWHIDHIIPISSFDLTKKEEQYKCFNYKNLQPMWWQENFKKHNKILLK